MRRRRRCISMFGTFSHSAKWANTRPTLVNNRLNSKKLLDTFYLNKKGLNRPKNRLSLLSLYRKWAGLEYWGPRAMRRAVKVKCSDAAGLCLLLDLTKSREKVGTEFVILVSSSFKELSLSKLQKKKIISCSCNLKILYSSLPRFVNISNFLFGRLKWAKVFGHPKLVTLCWTWQLRDEWQEVAENFRENISFLRKFSQNMCKARENARGRL